MIQRVFTFVLALMLCLPSFASIAEENNILKQGEAGEWEYLLYAPSVPSNTLLVYFSGSGEIKGSIWRTASNDALPLFVNTSKLIPNVNILIPHAKSKKDSTYFKTASLLEFVLKMKSDLGVEQVILSGHSFGANVAENLVAKHPENFSGLIAISGRAYCSVDSLIEYEIPILIVHGTRDSSKIASKTLSSYSKLFPSLNLKKGNKSLKELQSPYSEGECTLYWISMTHQQTPSVFLDTFVWEWMNKNINPEIESPIIR